MTRLDHGATIAIPARNEAETVVRVVELLSEQFESSLEIPYEILVVDDRSTDQTAERARNAGAHVVSTVDVCSSFSGSVGKGDAIWAAVRSCTTDLIGFVDADLTELNPRRCADMFTLLIETPSVKLVKGRVERTKDGLPSGPGRVTALTARPLLNLLKPDLSFVRDPLSGLFATRTEIIGSLWLDCDYGVDVGVLLDVADRFGADSIAEIDLGQIAHRQRPLDDLTTTAEQVARAILLRCNNSTIAPQDLLRRRPPALSQTRGMIHTAM